MMTRIAFGRPRGTIRVPAPIMRLLSLLAMPLIAVSFDAKRQARCWYELRGLYRGLVYKSAPLSLVEATGPRVARTATDPA
jgi:hypothetical protein